MHVKSKLVQGFVVFLIVTIAACGEKSSPVAAGADDGTSGGLKAPTCWIYQKYKAADCASLTALTDLNKNSRADYQYPTSSDKRYIKPTHMLDLTKVDLNRQVTRNFKLSEFLQVHKGRYGYFAEHVFGYVQKIRDQLKVPLTVTSAFRGPAYNKKIKGATLSRHMYGDALDLGGASMKKMQAACRAQGASFIQLYNDGHIHCDWRSHALDKNFYRTFAPAVAAAKTVALSESQFKEMQIELSGQPIIAIDGDIRKGGEVEFTASLETQEEDGALLTEWIITAPNGEVFTSSEVAAKYLLSHSGHYSVYVRLGGYSEITYDLDVP